MTSILTNTAALSSLQALSVTQGQLSKTQAQISSGLAVACASDNAAYWAIGRQMAAQISGLNAVNQGLALTGSIVDVTAAALAAIKGALDKIHDDVVTARQAGIDKSALQSDISAQQQSIISVANAASFNGVNWLVNTLSSSLKIMKTIDIDVSRSEFNAVLLGQDPDHSSHLTSQQTETTTVTENGVTGSQTDAFGYDITTRDAHDGTPTTTSVRSPDTITGSADFSTFGDVSLPMSVSASGLSSSSFSLVPLTLFTNYTGGYSDQQTVTAGGLPDPEDSYGPNTSIGTSQSYDGYGGGAAPGILDPIVLTTTGNPSNASSPSPNSSSQQQVALGVGGGTIYTTGSSGGGGGSGSTAQVIQESILDLNIVATSAEDLTVIQQAVQTAIAGVVKASTVVGALQTQVSTQQAYNSALADSLTSGLGSLVDADMNVASTRLQALQTQQQLGIQALSIANGDSQIILKLFGEA